MEKTKNTIQIVVEKLHPDVPLPQKMTAGASGYDLRAYLEHPVPLAKGAHALVPTGLRIMMPRGLEAQVRARSGLAAKHGIMVLNGPGTIDSDYRGEIKVILFNAGNTEFVVQPGERIAQLIFAHVPATQLTCGQVAASSRGAGGFGSTGSA